MTTKINQITQPVISSFAVAGAALGILLAPDKVVNTRKKISQLGEEYLNNLKVKIQDVLLNAATEFDHVKNDPTKLVEKWKDEVDEVSNNIKNKAF